MTDLRPLLMSRQLITLAGTRTFVHHEDRIPQESAVLVVSNHRSFMDAPVLMHAIDRPIRFACHHYMGQIPILREIVTGGMGCFPLDRPDHRRDSFFHKAIQLLQARQTIGIFPEGGEPMVRLTAPQSMQPFQRGFAHLALRAPVSDLAVLPIAIASEEENTDTFFPVRLLSWVDPTEPLFRGPGLHPMVVYRRVQVMVGHPMWITPRHRERYQGKHAKTVVKDLMDYCQTEIKTLLHADS